MLLSMAICQALVDECKVTKDWAISRYDIIEKSYEIQQRMTAIANITGNVTIATSKALLIDEAIRQMQNGVCHFVFQKKDGTITERFGTLNPALCSQHIKGTGKSPELRGCTLFWDVVSGGFRSFLWQNFIAIL